MLVLTNWWWPFSIASIHSALDLNYRVHVVVSDSANDGVDWLLARQREYNDGRIQWTRDTMPRHSKAAHTLARFDYLPQVLEAANSPVLVTDADVIHQRPMTLPSGADVALWRTDPRPLAEVHDYATSNRFPVWWSEFACTTMAEALIVAPTHAGREFAQRIKMFANSMREDGFGDRWGNDQVAILAAERRLYEDRIYDLNSRGRQDVTTHESAATWFPHPHQREDPNSPWSRCAARYYLDGPATTPHIIPIPDSIIEYIEEANLSVTIPLAATTISDSYVFNTRSQSNPSDTKRVLEGMRETVEAVVGKRLWPDSTFSRVYSRDAFLTQHRDRPYLDWTVSICLATDTEWPLECFIDGLWEPFIAGEGNGLLMPGMRLPHRRQAFSGETNVTLLLHYTEDERHAWGQRP